MSEFHEYSETRERRMGREYAVYQYTNALESGDIDTLLAVLHKAERDPVLEQMILTTQEVYQAEAHIVVDVKKVKQIDEWLDAPILMPLDTGEANNHYMTHPVSRRQRLQSFVYSLAAVLVVCALLSGFLLLIATRSSVTGSASQPPTWKTFSPSIPGANSNGLNNVSVVSTNDIWAVGGYHINSDELSLVEHWNGKQWDLTNNNIKAYLYGVTAIATNDVWAVGFTSHSNEMQETQTVIEHWDGKVWKVVSSPNSSFKFNVLYSVAAVSTHDIWAVGRAYNSDNTQEDVLIEHWDGSQWNLVKGATIQGFNNILYSITAISAHDVWAVGTSQNGVQGLIEHWNGKQWKIIGAPDFALSMGVLYAVKARSASDVWAVGISQEKYTLIEHWNGSNWTRVPGQNPGHVLNSLGAVAISSTDDVWVAGYFSDVPLSSSSMVAPQTLIEHWNGKQWSVVKGPNKKLSIFGIASDSQARTVWMVGDVYMGGTLNQSRIVELSPAGS